MSDESKGLWNRLFRPHKSDPSLQPIDALASTNEILFSVPVPITDDDQFIEQFGNDPSAPLPDYIHDQRWWKTTGQQLYMRAFQEAALKHRQEVEKYEALLASTKEENKRIDMENERRRLEYTHACARHHKALKAHHQRDDLEYEKHAVVRLQWEREDTLERYLPDISRALLWDIYKRSFYSPARGKEGTLVIALGVARLLLTLAMCGLVPWGLILVPFIIICQCCYFACLFLRSCTYRRLWIDLLDSEAASPNLVTQLPEWHEMRRKLGRQNEPGTLGIQFNPLDYVEIDYFHHSEGGWEPPKNGDLDRDPLILVSILSIIPLVSFFLFVVISIVFFSQGETKDSFFKQVTCRRQTVWHGNRRAWTPSSPPSPPRLLLLPHKPLPLQQLPSFVPPPKPTRPKGERHV